jgi:hypothetical protein
MNVQSRKFSWWVKLGKVSFSVLNVRYNSLRDRPKITIRKIFGRGTGKGLVGWEPYNIFPVWQVFGERTRFAYGMNSGIYEFDGFLKHSYLLNQRRGECSRHSPSLQEMISKSKKGI